MKATKRTKFEIKLMKKAHRKIKYNSKITKILCLHCNHTKPVQKMDAIFCSALCRVQEENYRKSIGMAKIAGEASYDELKKQHSVTWMESNALRKDFSEIQYAISTNSAIENWKYLSSRERFIIYFTPNSKTKAFKLYLNTKVDQHYREVKKRADFCNAPNINYRYIPETA